MKQIVSYETAKKLKEAGFPQPEPELGQYWESGLWGGPCIVCKRSDTQSQFLLALLMLVDGSHNLDAGPMIIRDKEFPLFYPTAIDILRVIPSDYNLSFLNDKFYLTDGGVLSLLYSDENPSECCAKAWLGINAKGKTSSGLHESLNDLFRKR